MVHELKRALASQLRASLAMLRECVEKCPDEHWDGLIAKYPFWMVAYHALCFLDCYLAPTNEAFEALLGERAAAEQAGRLPRLNLHPLGMKELEEEYPSRRFGRVELLAYCEVCRGRIGEVLGEGVGSETPESLAGASGFSWYACPRLEMHLCNLRHVQHHAGQLTAFLRRAGVETGWVKAG